MSKPNLEHLALNRVRERYPQLRRGGFAHAVRSLEIDLDNPLPFIPDVWFRMRLVYEGEPDSTLFVCIEIEDSNPLTATKLQHYLDLWDHLDSLDHGLRLLVFDRYGYNEREIDLYQIYFETLVEDARIWRLNASPAERDALYKRMDEFVAALAAMPKETS